jgi:hypothetical protein
MFPDLGPALNSAGLFILLISKASIFFDKFMEVNMSEEVRRPWLPYTARHLARSPELSIRYELQEVGSRVKSFGELEKEIAGLVIRHLPTSDWSMPELINLMIDRKFLKVIPGLSP